MNGSMFCAIESVENGLVVRFYRAEKQTRQRQNDLPDFAELARIGAYGIGRALREKPEAWQENAAEIESEVREASEKPKPAALEEVWILSDAAIYVPADDPALLSSVVTQARAASEQAKKLGLTHPHQYAVAAGIGLTQAGR